ncbi:uncharacterized protein L3040_001759 [Drepanopeziza brunnea f. sp. 'multigermtubi']|uniref:Uncharacterized protein n=1 Tax=Marssonina brunnea f. sp. multigermtubi (strain MB_m1) TaxID=1072389 RepID=K1WSK3_MARBU|nr:uncharacterized protein MBM_06608 [Drepanopeziza brunnea f. sp. 'multigermtubi' MB_m1]EKD15392.1 hypothetical protein MBM_06608 [Drepanopeziza brunnea f. sp. 'multigermtubi' MB_m1]KAJ5051999.1 hypothetical protein L3040_001759 [Drepanopeziza brunnea f. sp. 'multigermtubi']
MPRLSQFLCPTVLALSFLLTGAQAQDGRKIIGYRTVNKEEAEYINENHKPSTDDDFDDEEGPRQLGEVGYFYTTNTPPGWQGDEDDWYCVVKANSEKIDAAEKVWVPEYYAWGAGSSADPNKMYLWSGDEGLLTEYITSLAKPGGTESPDPATALRFSYIAFWDKQQLQMVIPDALLKDDELDLWAECYETEAKLEEQATETVDWNSWRILGGPGQESEVWPYVQPDNEEDWPYKGPGTDKGEA